MNTRCEPWNQNRFALIQTNSVRTQWFALSGGGRTMETPVSPRLKQSSGCGGKNFIRVLRSHRILLQLWYVICRMKKFLGLLIGLQTFAVI